MPDDNRHRDVVDGWAARIARDSPSRQTIDAFDDAFGRLWQRARATLGDITLIAISDRVLDTASRQFGLLEGVRTSDSGLDLDKLRQRADSLDSLELLLAAQFVLTEFLTVLGKLVADILTPALHAELAKVTTVQSAAEKDIPS